MTNGEGDAGAAFDRAASRVTRMEEITRGGELFSRRNERRYRVAVVRFVLVLLLLPAHVVAMRSVTGWLVAHLVLAALLGSGVVQRWLARRDDQPLGL